MKKKSSLERIADLYTAEGKHDFAMKLLSIQNNPDLDRSLLRKFCYVVERQWAANGLITHDDPWKVFLEIRKCGRGVTRNKLIVIYGKDLGEKKWNEYCEKQRTTNTFEYKSEKYGWSRSEFEQYNSSRATTLENMILRYGNEDGTKRWNEYREKQSYAGCSLEYFIERYGEEIGRERYDELRVLKGKSLDSFIKRFGDPVEAKNRYIEYWENYKTTSAFRSKAADAFCTKLLDVFDGYKIYTGALGKEYCVYSEDLDRIFFYDFVVPELKLCIEYNGAYYHAKPELYAPDAIIHHGLTASEIWEQDAVKNMTIEKERGFRVIIVWEGEEETSLERIKNEYARKQECDPLSEFFD